MDTSVIPKGYYCYDDKGKCPYWELRSDKPKEENGYCKYLQIGDWEEDGMSLLFDQCKECNINTYTSIKVVTIISIIEYVTITTTIDFCFKIAISKNAFFNIIIKRHFIVHLYFD